MAKRRHKRLTEEDLNTIFNMKESEGLTSRKIARILGLPKSTVTDFLRGDTHKWFWESPRQDTKPPKKVKSSTLSNNKWPDPVSIETSTNVRNGSVHYVIGDTQYKSGISADYLIAVGRHIAEVKPYVIVHIGDHFDMPSLSSYDKGKASAEGRRVVKDIIAGRKGMNALLQPIKEAQEEDPNWKPKMVFTLGNHEERLSRYLNDTPELQDLLTFDDYGLEENGWEVYPYLTPAIVNGVPYIHYVPNPMSGKPYGGSALSIIKNIGSGFTMGHKQTKDVAQLYCPLTGKVHNGLILGACYLHDEEYKGNTGNNHFRGVAVKHNVVDGDYNLTTIRLEDIVKEFL